MKLEELKNKSNKSYLDDITVKYFKQELKV